MSCVLKAWTDDRRAGQLWATNELLQGLVADSRKMFVFRLL